MQVYVIRHPPVIKDSTVCHGQYDFPINSEKENIFLEYYSQKIDFSSSSLYSSPLERCLSFAKKLKNNSRGQEAIKQDKRLMEFSYGDWEGKKWSDIDNNLLDNWMKNYVNQSPPVGESLIDFKKRVDDFFQYLLKEENSLGSDETHPVVIVTHIGVIRILFSTVLNVPLESIFDIDVDYGAILNLDYQKKWSVVSFQRNLIQ